MASGTADLTSYSKLVRHYTNNSYALLRDFGYTRQEIAAVLSGCNEDEDKIKESLNQMALEGSDGHGWQRSDSQLKKDRKAKEQRTKRKVFAEGEARRPMKTSLKTANCSEDPEKSDSNTAYYNDSNCADKITQVAPHKPNLTKTVEPDSTKVTFRDSTNISTRTATSLPSQRKASWATRLGSGKQHTSLEASTEQVAHTFPGKSPVAGGPIKPVEVAKRKDSWASRLKGASTTPKAVDIEAEPVELEVEIPPGDITIGAEITSAPVSEKRETAAVEEVLPAREHHKTKPSRSTRKSPDGNISTTETEPQMAMKSNAGGQQADAPEEPSTIPEPIQKQDVPIAPRYDTPSLQRCVETSGKESGYPMLYDPRYPLGYDYFRRMSDYRRPYQSQYRGYPEDYTKGYDHRSDEIGDPQRARPPGSGIPPPHMMGPMDYGNPYVRYGGPHETDTYSGGNDFYPPNQYAPPHYNYMPMGQQDGSEAYRAHCGRDYHESYMRDPHYAAMMRPPTGDGYYHSPEEYYHGAPRYARAQKPLGYRNEYNEGGEPKYGDYASRY